MTEEKKLTPEQEAFLEECLLEFSDRYTDADEEYKKIAKSGIPKPPIMCPWTTRRFNNINRDRAGSSRYYNNRGDGYHRYDHNSRDKDRHPNAFYEGRSDRRFRPY